MRKQLMTLAIALGTTWGVTACGNGQARGNEAPEAVPGEADVEATDAAAPFVEREFWLALAEEPAFHLNQARTLYLDHQFGPASEELGKAAAILNFESRHAHSPYEEGLLLASVEELREVAREVRFEDVPYEGIPDVTELDRVEALTFRAIAAHQVTLARDALEAGDARMAGRYTSETAKALQLGFDRAGYELDPVVSSKLDNAREVAARMEMEGEGSMEQGLETLDNLDAAVKELGEAVTGGRK